MKDLIEKKPGFKKTKIGWIPKDWSAEILEGAATRETGHTPDRTKAEYWDGDIAWVSLADSSSLDQRSIRSTKKTISSLGLRHSSARLLPQGTVIMLRDASVGRVSVLNREMAVSQHFVAWICSVRVHNLFLYYWFLWQRRYFEKMAFGSTIVTIGMSFFKKLQVPLPPLPEQKKISEILSTWDEAIEQTRKLIDAKKRRKKGLMQQLLTGKKQVPGFEGEWRPVPIGKLFKTVCRPLDWDDKMVYSLLSIRRRSGGVFMRERLQGSNIKTKVMFEAKAGDFLISKMQVLHGATGLVPEEFDGMHISGSYIALCPHNKARVNSRFFSRLSSMPEFYHLTFVSSYGVHIEKMTFNLRWFMKAKVKVPTKIEEQTAITNRLEVIDKEINYSEAQLKAIEQQKRGLMQKLLTGTVRVKI